MTYSNEAAFDALRSIAGSAITSSYQNLGSELSLPGVVIAFKNTTDGDVLVSVNGSTAILIIPASSYSVYDVRTNAPSSLNYMFAEGTQFQVKAGPTSPTMGNFYMELIIAQKVT